MPKAAKTSRPSSSQQSPKGFAALRHWYSKRSTTQLLIVALVLLAAGFFGFKQAQIYQERSIYRSAEKQITAFVDEAAKLAPSTKEVRRYCRYSSAKIDRGPLGCTITGEIEFDSLSGGRIEEIVEHIGSRQVPEKWRYIRDNTFNYTHIPKTELKNLIFEFSGLSCGIRFMHVTDEGRQTTTEERDKILKVTADCTGPARDEYYRVVVY